MRRLVLDTSALMRLYVPDGPIPSGLEGEIDQAARGDLVLLVPELALVEVGQVLRKKEQAGLLTASECDEIRDAILDLPLDVVGHRELLVAAVALARKRALTVYDAMFMALALDRAADLSSADERLTAAFQAERVAPAP